MRFLFWKRKPRPADPERSTQVVDLRKHPCLACRLEADMCLICPVYGAAFAKMVEHIEKEGE